MGDVDTLVGGGSRAARIVSVISRQTVAGETSMRTLAGQQPFELTMQAPDRVAVVEIVVRLSAEVASDGPTYRASPLKLGAPFTFDSSAYIARGSIIRSMRLEK